VLIKFQFEGKSSRRHNAIWHWRSRGQQM